MRVKIVLLMVCSLLVLSCSTDTRRFNVADYKSLHPVSIHSLTNAEIRVLSVRLQMLSFFCSQTNPVPNIDCSTLEQRYISGHQRSISRILEKLGALDNPQVKIFEFEKRGASGESGFLSVSNNIIIRKWVLAEW